MSIRSSTTLNIDINQRRFKHLDEFVDQRFDYVVTVCDQVRERCPIFPNAPRQIPWSLRDPAAVNESEEEQFQSFRQTARELTTRISYLRLMLA